MKNDIEYSDKQTSGDPQTITLEERMEIIRWAFRGNVLFQVSFTEMGARILTVSVPDVNVHEASAEEVERIAKTVLAPGIDDALKREFPVSTKSNQIDYCG